MSRAALLALWAARAADPRPAVVCAEVTLSWRAAWAAICATAGQLRDAHVGPGDRVLIVSENCHRALIGTQAVIAAGGIAVPVNPRLTAVELARIIEHVGPRAGIIHPHLRAHARAALRAAGIDLPLLAVRAGGRPGRSFEPLLADDPHDPVALFLTSGSTGQPKGVVLGAAGLIANSVSLTAAAELQGDMRYLHLAPHFHLADGAASMAATLLGHTHRIVGRFRPGPAAAAIAAGEADWTVCVPAIVARLADDPAMVSTPVIGRLVYGGAAMPRSVLERVAATWAPNLVQTYGLSETTSVVSALTAREHRAALDGSLDAAVLASVGRAVSGVEVRLDPSSGEIQVRGPNLMLGYWSGTAIDRWPSGAWFATGDVAYERDGYLMLAGRLKDIINTGGEKVHSAEVERALLGVRGVREVAVVGFLDDRWGERVHAVVRIDPGVTEAQLVAGLESAIARFKHPRSWTLTTDPLPATGSGKVDRAAVRALAAGIAE